MVKSIRDRLFNRPTEDIKNIHDIDINKEVESFLIRLYKNINDERREIYEIISDIDKANSSEYAKANHDYDDKTETLMAISTILEKGFSYTVQEIGYAIDNLE